MEFIYLYKEGKEEVLRAVTTDGHRLSRLKRFFLPQNANNLTGVIIPRKETVTEIKKIIDNQDR